MYVYSVPFIYNIIVTCSAYFIKKYKIAPPPKIYNVFYNATLSAVSLYISVCVAYIWHREGELYGPICLRTPPEIAVYARIFYWLKYVEWYDTIYILLKNGGELSEISNLHFYHHAIVPVMVHYGLGQPGDIYAILSNSVAHFLMYGYYAFPEQFRAMKSYITYYQMTQHVGAFIIVAFHSVAPQCKVSYPYINILGYMFFLYEYLALILHQVAKLGGGIVHIECPVCIISSLVYLTNAAHAYHLGDCVFGASFLILTATSVIFRLNPEYLVIDYLAIGNVVYLGAKKMLSQYVEGGMNSSVFIIVVIFLFVNYIHINNQSVVMSQHLINYRHVVFIHVASSIAFHLMFVAAAAA